MLCCRNENRYSKTETMCLSRQPKQCSLQIDGVPLKQSEKFKYLGVSFTSDGRQNSELDIYIGKASAVVRQLHRSVVLKRELCTKLNFARLKLRTNLNCVGMDIRHECPRKEQPKNCSVQHRLAEGLEAVPELDGEIT